MSLKLSIFVSSGQNLLLNIFCLSLQPDSESKSGTIKSGFEFLDEW